MFLTPVGIRLEKRDAMSALVQGTNNAAVIRRSAVPVGREQAGAKERNLHQATSSIPAVRLSAW